MTVTHSSRMLPLGSYTFDLKTIIKVKFNGSLEGKKFGKSTFNSGNQWKVSSTLLPKFPADVLEDKDTKRIDAKTVSIRHIFISSSHFNVRTEALSLTNVLPGFSTIHRLKSLSCRYIPALLKKLDKSIIVSVFITSFLRALLWKHGYHRTQKRKHGLVNQLMM